jgi:hypothetical protein
MFRTRGAQNDASRGALARRNDGIGRMLARVLRMGKLAGRPRQGPPLQKMKPRLRTLTSSVLRHVGATRGRR